MSLYFRVITIDAIVVFGANRIRTTCYAVKSPVSLQVWVATSSRGLSLLRKVNGNKDTAKYQSEIMHDIEMKCECVVFPQKGYIFIHDLATCHNAKIARSFLDFKGIPILE